LCVIAGHSHAINKVAAFGKRFDLAFHPSRFLANRQIVSFDSILVDHMTCGQLLFMAEEGASQSEVGAQNILVSQRGRA
jgi:hypothetical protein